jgi:chemotaxis response regulator CheB
MRHRTSGRNALKRLKLQRLRNDIAAKPAQAMNAASQRAREPGMAAPRNPALAASRSRRRGAGRAPLIVGTSFAAGGSAAVAAFLHCIVPML